MARRTVDFVGSGLAFPLQLAPTRAVALASGRIEIEQAILLILSTAPGERPMRPEFGCGIHDYVFAPANSTTAGQLAHEVRLALERLLLEPDASPQLRLEVAQRAAFTGQRFTVEDLDDIAEHLNRTHYRLQK